MATKFTRDPQTGAYLITNTQSGETRRYETQKEFAAACLIDIYRHSEEMEAGLARLESMYTRGHAYHEAPEIEVWPS